jgi:hypothetical protein
MTARLNDSARAALSMIDTKNEGRCIMTAESDISWSADKKLHGWTLPQTAWPLKLWGVRHVRWMWLTNQVYQAADRWAAMGIGFGGPNQYDRWVLYAIYRGWA